MRASLSVTGGSGFSLNPGCVDAVSIQTPLGGNWGPRLAWVLCFQSGTLLASEVSQSRLLPEVGSSWLAAGQGPYICMWGSPAHLSLLLPAPQISILASLLCAVHCSSGHGVGGGSPDRAWRCTGRYSWPQALCNSEFHNCDGIGWHGPCTQDWGLFWLAFAEYKCGQAFSLQHLEMALPLAVPPVTHSIP